MDHTYAFALMNSPAHQSITNPGIRAALVDIAAALPDYSGVQYIDGAYLALSELTTDILGAQDGHVTQNVLPTPITSELLLSDAPVQDALALIRVYLSGPGMTVVAKPDPTKHSYDALCKLLRCAINHSESNPT